MDRPSALVILFVYICWQFLTAQGLQCYLCGEGETSDFCNATTFATACKDDTQACYVTVTNNNNRLFSRKGCIKSQDCAQLRNQNGMFCEEGVVTAKCTWCCQGEQCNRDLYGYGTIRTTTTTAMTTIRPVRPTAVIDTDLDHCLAEYKMFLNQTVMNPTDNFPHFCRELPYILLCLSTARCEDDAERQKGALLANQLQQLCPRDCDVTAGDNCTAQFVSAVTDIITFGNGDQCTEIQREVGKYISCLAYSTGSCDGAASQRFQLTLKAIKRESDTLCIGHLATPAPTPPTEPDDCQIQFAVNTVNSFTVKVVYLLYGGFDPTVLCAHSLPETERTLTKALASCSQATRSRVDTAFQIPRNLLGLSCDTVTPPPLCDPAEARKCIVDFWTMVDESKDAQKYCSLIKPTRECVNRYTAGCSDQQRTEIQNLLQVFINRIGDACDDVIKPYTPCNQTVTLHEGGPEYDLSFTMIKSPKDLCKGKDSCEIYVDLAINNVNGPKCPNGKDVKQVVCRHGSGSACSQLINDRNWRNTITFHLAAAVDLQNDGNISVEVSIVIRKVINGTTEEIRTVCIIHVIVVDYDKPNTGVCSSSNDPHLHTFDKWFYNNYLEGIFLMYKHKTLPYEVQAIFQKCYPVATCNCGIAIRSGDFVFVAESCARRAALCDNNSRHICNRHGSMRIYTFGYSPRPAMRVYKSGPNLEVVLPHGTRITIIYDALHKLINFVIYASIYDFGRNTTEGLCGNFDGNVANDLTLPNGQVHVPTGAARTMPNIFNKSWRLELQRSIFSGVTDTDYESPEYCSSPPQGSSSTPRCDVIGLVETCHITKGEEIPLPQILRAPPIEHDPTKRQRREASTSFEEIIDFDEKHEPSEANLTVVLSEATARAYCEEYLQRRMEWSKMCMGLPYADITRHMQACVDDLMLTGDYEWADTALESFKQDCINQLNTDVQYSNTFQGRLMRDKIFSLTCPNMCNKNGKCVNGQCLCSDPFTGYDCSLTADTSVPQFLSLQDDGLCDVTRANCSNVVLFGTNFISSPSLTCHFAELQVTDNMVTETSRKFDIRATYITNLQILCPSPNLVSPDGSIGWSIDVSNNGKDTSKSPVILISRDPRCAVCSLEFGTNTASCIRQKDTCIIGNKCYTNGQRNPDDSCQQCKPSSSTKEWNSVKFCTLNMLALVVCILVIVFIVAVLLVIICCCRKCRAKDKNVETYKPANERTQISLYENVGENRSRSIP